MTSLMFQATLFLAAAVIAVPIAARFGLGSVLGYLLAGLVIGPGLGLVNDAETIKHFAEFGVVIMLFIIGLELEPRALWDMRHRLIGLGGLQVALTTGAIFAFCQYMGLTWTASLGTGMILALSSTAIVLQTLNEKNLMSTQGGRSAFSVLLTQDIVVIPMLILLPLLAAEPTLMISEDGSIQRGISQIADAAHDEHHEYRLADSLPGWGVALLTFGVVAAIILGGIYGARPLFRYIHAANLPEMFTALALLIVIGIAFVMGQLGLSAALGTFLAGVVLANSEFRHELEASVEPFKGMLLGLFFITVGAGMDVNRFMEEPLTLLALSLGLCALKGIILGALGKLFRLRGRDAWLFGLSLAQAGEFGFVLVSVALTQHVVPDAIGQQIQLIIAISMLITPLLFMAHDWLAKRAGGEATTQKDDKIDTEAPVIIAGIGRFGQLVYRLVQFTGHKTVVVDNDMETIQMMRRLGYKGFFGDPSRPELLNAAGLQKAHVLVAALDDPKAVTRLVTYARRMRPDLHIIARARDRQHVYALYQAGANDIVREMFDSGLRAGRYVLENIGLSEYEAAMAQETFYHRDRENLRELAELWDPSIKIADNAAYIERSQVLEKELEAKLFTALETNRQNRAEERERSNSQTAAE